MTSQAVFALGNEYEFTSQATLVTPVEASGLYVLMAYDAGEGMAECCPLDLYVLQLDDSSTLQDAVDRDGRAWYAPSDLHYKGRLTEKVQSYRLPWHDTVINDLHLICYTPEFRQRIRSRYWYAVEHGTLAHTAFQEREHLLSWLDVRGLELSGPIPDKRGTHQTQDIAGSYRKRSHRDKDYFNGIEGEELPVLSNGEYTLGKITEDDEGMRTVHYLNPNVRDRPVFDHAESRGLVG